MIDQILDQIRDSKVAGQKLHAISLTCEEIIRLNREIKESAVTNIKRSNHATLINGVRIIESEYIPYRS